MGAAPSTQNRPGNRMSSYPGARPQMQHNPSWRPPTQASSGNRSSSGTATINGPGAFSISRNATGSPQLFRVTIPQNTRPNQEFQVYAGNRIVRVRCPPGSRPGQIVQIEVPPEDLVHNASQTVAVLTDAEGGGGGGAVRMNSQARMSNASQTISNTANQQQQQSQQQQPQAYNVVIPAGVRPGRTFPVSVNGRTLQVQCPQNARPGMTVRIVPPPSMSSPPPGVQSATNLNRPPEERGRSEVQTNRRTMLQTFEVVVPQGVRPNQPFSLIAGGQRVMVNCPANAKPGSRIRFNLPVSVDEKNDKTESGHGNVSQSFKYDTEDGWTRSTRVSDGKFIWIRMDRDGKVIQEGDKFDIETSAYVGNLQFLEGNDIRMRTGRLILFPASTYAVDSVVKDEHGREVVGQGEISTIQRKPFNEKAAWLQRTCKKLGVPWEEGHMRICVRRENLLDDSVKAVMSLGRQDMKKTWRFEFIGEEGIDAGGLAKEWFLLVTQAILDADSGLWLSSTGNQMLMRINPASEVSCPEDHLIYFRFLGRVLGKALFEGQLVSGHLVQYLYKYMLGWPITFDDLESVDPDIFENMKKLMAMNPDEIEYLCLDFTATQRLLGETQQVALCPGGEEKEVNGDNLNEYIECYFRYLMLDRIKAQVTELLLGFYDVVPEPILTVFDYQELEIMMCGLPKINMDDWKKNTLYTGNFEGTKARSNPCKWFWEIVTDEYDQEMRARLLQFITGTSGVPSRGFSVLQGSDGNIKLFTLNGIDMRPNVFPKAHTCFNRLDLPMYKSKAMLREKLTYAITNCQTGFHLE